MNTITQTRAQIPADEAVLHRAGICVGTVVMSLKGELPVEQLKAGDRVITRDGVAIVRDVTARKAKVYPVRIKASSLGHNRPQQDAIVSLTTYLHLRDWRAEALYGEPAANVAAGRLVDGEYVSLEPPCDTVVYDLAFDDDQIIYAGGVEILTLAA